MEINSFKISLLTLGEKLIWVWTIKMKDCMVHVNIFVKTETALHWCFNVHVHINSTFKYLRIYILVLKGMIVYVHIQTCIKSFALQPFSKNGSSSNREKI